MEPKNTKMAQEWRCLLRTLGFIKAPAKKAAMALEKFLNESTKKAPAWENPGGPLLGDVISYKARRGATTLTKAFEDLDPLVQPIPTKFLFVETRGGWTAFFTNLFGGDAGGSRELVLSKELGTKALSFVSSDERSESFSQMFYFYDRGRERRELYVVEEEEGNYLFWNKGKPFSFEKPAMYKKKRTRDRFTREMLLSYIDALGLHPYDESFYVVNSKHPTYLVERFDKDPKIKSRLVFTSLAQAKKIYNNK